MATFLSKLFKPKWQSNHLATRLDAVKNLNESSDSEQSILLSLAKTDPDNRVKSAAITKLQNSEQLIELHKSATIDIKAVIEQRLYELASAQSLTIFDLILDTRLLTEIIIRSEQSESFISGLARIEDPEALLSIASSGKTARIRQAAAELLESEQQLLALAASAKSKDKSVYQIAKAKLTLIKSLSKAQEERQNSIEKILASLEEHASTENTQLYQARLSALLERWDGLKQDANADHMERFQTASNKCSGKLQALLDSKQQEEEQQRRIQTGGDEQEATLMTLSATLERFKSEVASVQEIPALDALIKIQETRWLEATRQLQAGKQLNRRYQNLMTELRSYLGSLKAINEHSSEIESLISNIDETDKNTSKLNTLATKLNHLVRTINWPEAYRLPSLLVAAKEAQGHSVEIKQQHAESAKELELKIDHLFKQLDQSLEDRQVKQSASLLKQLQRVITQLNSSHKDQFSQALSLRQKQLNDLRDWKGYASSPHQQALCEAMEKLCELHIEPQIKADKIKAMQKEWKALGGAADQELWLKFKAASDKAYEPCAIFFSEQNQLKENNSEKRRKLIAELEAFIENNDWQNADWKAVELINKKARNEWKEAYPVNFKTNRPLQEKFNSALEKLDQLLDQERSKNLALKTAIVNKAQELADLEDLDQAIIQAKKLQQEWQQVGITPHKQDRILWKTYREACDKVFARRDQARDSIREEAEQAIQHSELFFTDLKKFMKSAKELDIKTLKENISDFRKHFKALPSLPFKKQEAQQDRFESCMRELKELCQTLNNQQQVKQWHEVKRRAAICRDYYVSTAGDQSASEDHKQLAQLDKEMESQQALPDAIESSLKSLWIALKAGAIKQSQVVSEAEARALCIRCEIAAGLDSPENDKDLRMQLQVSRLSEGMSSSTEHHSREEQLNALLSDWYQKVGLSNADFEPLEQRIDRAISHLLG